jgi:hypothetical protein
VTPSQPARWHSRPRRALAGAALLLGTCLAAGVVAVSAEPGAAPGIAVADPPAQPLITSAPPPQPGSATVTLITGDQVRLDTGADGQQDASVVNATTDAFPAPAVQFSWGGDQYLVPGEAVPYLGGLLDPALFNISYLVRAKLDDGSNPTLPVTIEEAGARAADLPGVRVAGATGGTAAAAVAKSEAGAFGTRLGQSWQSTRAGTSATPIGRLPGIERISLAAPAGTESPPELRIGGAGTGPHPGAGTPNAPRATTSGTATRYRTVTLDPIDRSGRPGVAVGFLHNLDDPRAFAMLFAAAGAGPLSFSVPEGRYSAEISVLDGPVNDFLATGTLVLEPEVAVTADRTITLDARRGVPYRPNVEPAVQPGFRVERLSFTRVNQVRDGASAGNPLVGLNMRLYGRPELGGPTLHVTPTAPVTSGHLELLGMTTFTDTAQGSVNPKYVFAYRWDRAIPSTLTPAVPRAELTTVRSAAYRSPSGPASADPDELITLLTPLSRTNILHPGQVPFGERVDYWYTNAPDTVVWAPFLSIDGSTLLYGERRMVRSGEEIRLTWNKGPLAPSAAARFTDSTLFDSPYTGQPDRRMCAACRQDDNGIFAAWAFGDSSPGHHARSEFGTITDRFSFDFYRNGTLALSSRTAPDHTFGHTMLLLPMLPEPAGYRIQWDVSRNGDPQAWVRTGWTFSSSRTDPGAALPGSSACSPDPERGCSFLPLLFVRYDLPLDLDGRAPAGAPFELTFHIGHQQYQAAPAGVTATVSVSFDGGTTWSEPAAATDQGNGRFTTPVTHPPLAETDGFVALRVQARDAAGNAVDQTITRAYGLTG